MYLGSYLVVLVLQRHYSITLFVLVAAEVLSSGDRLRKKTDLVGVLEGGGGEVASANAVAPAALRAANAGSMPFYVPVTAPAL